MKKQVFPILFAISVLLTIIFSVFGCQERITQDSGAFITFSSDTVRFDTVFTEQGSTTNIIMLYNRNKEAIEIESVKLSSGNNFQINIDGLSDPADMNNILIRGRDSAFMFIKATIDPLDEDSPILVEDSVIFMVNGNRQVLHLEAIGQDVIILRDTIFEGTTRLGGGKPYLVYDTIIAQGNVHIKEGTRFYMHDKAMMFFLGDLVVEGSLEQPVVFRGDRFDNILRDIPYDYSSGKWGGLFILNSKLNPKYDINYLDVHSGTVGLFCQSENTTFLPTIKIKNSRLHNFSLYGLVIENMNAEVVNTEITNCASYCVYLAGGKHTFVHNTIANYFNYKKENVSIHSVSREDVAAVYISDLSKNRLRTEVKFINNIITGWRAQNITLATALPDKYDGLFIGNLLRNDTLWFAEQGARNMEQGARSKEQELDGTDQLSISSPVSANIYIQDTDTIFSRTYFSREEGTYYDFRLDSVSPARNSADSLLALPYPLDRNGNNRFADNHPDAGCYEWQPTTTDKN